MALFCEIRNPLLIRSPTVESMAILNHNHHRNNYYKSPRDRCHEMRSTRTCTHSIKSQRGTRCPLWSPPRPAPPFAARAGIQVNTQLPTTAWVIFNHAFITGEEIYSQPIIHNNVIGKNNSAPQYYPPYYHARPSGNAINNGPLLNRISHGQRRLQFGSVTSTEDGKCGRGMICF